MKRTTADLGTPRRMFFAVLVVIPLVLAWNLSKPWRTGIEEHRVSRGRSLDGIFGRKGWLSLGTNIIWWSAEKKQGDGTLSSNILPGSFWEFAPCTQTHLRAMTPQDARGDFFSYRDDGTKAFGNDWRTNQLVIHEKQILLLRHSTDTQTVYALQAVEQRDGRGFFRSRKIIPAPESR